MTGFAIIFEYHSAFAGLIRSKGIGFTGIFRRNGRQSPIRVRRLALPTAATRTNCKGGQDQHDPHPSFHNTLPWFSLTAG
jgi:hypothetical protein